jgi:hypothetical protein
LNIFSHQGNANKNFNDIPINPIKMAIIKKTNNKCWQGFGVRGNEPLYIISGNVN